MGIEEIKALVGCHPDFPKPGIVFRDIFPVLRNPEAFEDLISLFVSHVKEEYCKDGQKIDVVVGLDARGFLFAPLIALRLGAAFVPVRKRGKLPGAVETIAYSLEYGEAAFDIQKDSIKPGQRVFVIDDLLATGGSLSAACSLVEKLSGKVVEAAVVIELTGLNGRKKVSGTPVFSLLQYD